MVKSIWPSLFYLTKGASGHACRDIYCYGQAGIRNGDKTNLHFWLDLFPSGVVEKPRRSLGYAYVFRLARGKNL